MPTMPSAVMASSATITAPRMIAIAQVARVGVGAHLLDHAHLCRDAAGVGLDHLLLDRLQ